MAYTTIDNAAEYFQTVLYTGNETNRTITFDDTDANTDPDMVWIKARNDANSHELFDSVRGVQKPLFPDGSAVEGSTSDSLTAFNTDGFNLGTGGGINGNSDTLVAWCWKESATAGFDIVTFTGNQTARTISHSLSAKPEWMWIKNREKDENWHMFHGTLGGTFTAESNTTDTFGNGSTIWNDTDPTTSVFTLGNNGNINETGSDIVIYLWAGKQGFSKFGVYTGNGSTDGPFVYTGFKPEWLMIKKSSAAGNNWQISDGKRSPINCTNERLFLDVPDVEATDSLDQDFLSNGFKIRKSSTLNNASGATYVYWAFANSPFVNSKGVPTNAR